MARHRKVSVAIWNDEKFCALSDDGQLLFLFLLTHPNQTSLGAMRATLAGLAEERGWLPERLHEAFQEASSKGMAEYDPKARCLWLPNFLRHNGPESPNVVKAWASAVELIPECILKRKAIQRAKDILQGYGEAFRKAFSEAFPKAMPNPEQEQEQEQEPNTQNARARPPAAVPRETNLTRVELDDVPSQLLGAIKGMHPAGTYRQSCWLLAEREIRARLEEGFTAEQMFEGDKRYALQAEARGSVGTQFVIGPDRFFRERMFLEPFPLPAKRLTATEELLANIDRSRNSDSTVIEHEPEPRAAAAQ